MELRAKSRPAGDGLSRSHGRAFKGRDLLSGMSRHHEMRLQAGVHSAVAAALEVEHTQGPSRPRCGQNPSRRRKFVGPACEQKDWMLPC